MSQRLRGFGVGVGVTQVALSVPLFCPVAFPRLVIKGRGFTKGGRHAHRKRIGYRGYATQYLPVANIYLGSTDQTDAARGVKFSDGRGGTTSSLLPYAATPQSALTTKESVFMNTPKKIVKSFKRGFFF